MPRFFKEDFLMSLTINNIMAYTSARYLSSSYNRLSDSTRKLSSGLRVNTAADDAAGLAIRELMRSDIAALNQGAGNAATGDGGAISTRERAQKALEALQKAIVSKDGIRAHLGAMQNRLENTISNLQIQAENLQAAESRISDVDVASEMTNFVKKQILTQSAVAMLSQANSLPRLALNLL